MRQFLQVLPSIATHPLAILGYIAVAISWTIALFHRDTGVILAHLFDRAKTEDILKIAKNADLHHCDLGYVPRKDRRAVVTRKYLLIAFVATLLLAAIIVVVAFTKVEPKRVEAKVAGTIYDDAGTPLPNVLVNVVGLGSGMTDFNGSFTFSIDGSRDDYTVTAFLKGFSLEEKKVSKLVLEAMLFTLKVNEPMDQSSAESATRQGDSCMDRGDSQKAFEAYDHALKIYIQLVEHEGGKDLADNLAMAYVNRARAYESLSNHKLAIADYNNGIDMYTRLIEEEETQAVQNAWTDNLDNLAWAFDSRGTAFAQLHEYLMAMQDFARAVDIRTELVKQKGREKLADDLADSVTGLTDAYNSLDRKQLTNDDLHWVEDIHARLIEHSGKSARRSDGTTTGARPCMGCPPQPLMTMSPANETGK